MVMVRPHPLLISSLRPPLVMVRPQPLNPLPINSLRPPLAPHHHIARRSFDAVELYCKANHHMEAANLITELAKKSAERKVCGWVGAGGAGLLEQACVCGCGCVCVHVRTHGSAPKALYTPCRQCKAACARSCAARLYTPCTEH